MGTLINIGNAGFQRSRNDEYVDKSCDSRALFQDLEIASHPSFEQHLNKYAVLYLDMTAFMDEKKDEHIVDRIKKKLKDDIVAAYPDIFVGINYDRNTKQHTCRIEKLFDS